MSSPPVWLATLINLRRQTLHDRHRHLGEARQAEEVLAEKMTAVESQLADLAETRRRISAAGDCDISLLLAAQRHQGALMLELQTATKQTQLLAQEVERRQNAVVEAEQQVRSLEKLSERKVDQARREAERREAKRLDELAIIMQPTGATL